MYSVLISKIMQGMPLVNKEISKYIKANSKAVILPWAFPVELDKDKLLGEYFKKGETKYNKYVNSLLDLGIKEENIFIGNCYSNSKDLLKQKISESDILLLPGGNPEMFFSKVVHETEILYDIKYYKGIIIGESAGCELHLKRYFITAKNNYYKYFAFYDGFGIIDNPFYMDVHTTNNKRYINKLQETSNKTNKKIYAIFDDGALILNRQTNEVQKFGNVIELEPNK